MRDREALWFKDGVPRDAEGCEITPLPKAIAKPTDDRTIEQLRAEHDRLGKILDEYDQNQRRAERIGQVGKCYRRVQENSTSYLYVTGLNGDGWPMPAAFEFNDGGYSGYDLTICLNTMAPDMEIKEESERSEEISREEFDVVWKRFVARVAALDPHNFVPYPMGDL